MARNQELYDAISKGKRKDVESIVNKEIAAGADPVKMLLESMVPAMRDLGDRFSRNEVYVPEMLIAARAMQAGLNIIEPMIAARGHKPLGKVCIGTVKGDLHDIGKNLVAMMLKGAGFAVMDLGVDCDVQKFSKAVDEGAQAVCLSALLTTTMPYMKDVVAHFKARPNVKVVIGGAPVTQQYASEIGAHGYADNAGEAVRAVERCLGLAK
jgi:5-methyltetrahydrofolate--homocysteine methyltransferase